MVYMYIKTEIGIHACLSPPSSMFLSHIPYIADEKVGKIDEENKLRVKTKEKIFST